jgi:hypothetical protein
VRQESRLLWLSEGDAPTKFFHIHAYTRRRKNSVHSLECNGKTLVTEDHTTEAVFDFFDDNLGRPACRSHTVNLWLLDFPRLNLVELGILFMEEDVLSVIRSLPP